MRFSRHRCREESCTPIATSGTAPRRMKQEIPTEGAGRPDHVAEGVAKRYNRGRPMNPEIIDPDALARLEEWGGEELVAQMVRLFLQNSPERLDQIRTVAGPESGDIPERGAHSLKSSAANVGAVRVRAVAAEMESAATAGNLERVRQLLPRLEDAYREAVAALNEILE